MRELGPHPQGRHPLVRIAAVGPRELPAASDPRAAHDACSSSNKSKRLVPFVQPAAPSREGSSRHRRPAYSDTTTATQARAHPWPSRLQASSSSSSSSSSPSESGPSPGHLRLPQHHHARIRRRHRPCLSFAAFRRLLLPALVLPVILDHGRRDAETHTEVLHLLARGNVRRSNAALLSWHGRSRRRRGRRGQEESARASPSWPEPPRVPVGPAAARSPLPTPTPTPTPTPGRMSRRPGYWKRTDGRTDGRAPGGQGEFGISSDGGPADSSRTVVPVLETNASEKKISFSCHELSWFRVLGLPPMAGRSAARLGVRSPPCLS